MDQISTPWVTVCLVQLLSQCVGTEETLDEGVAGADTPAGEEVDAVIGDEEQCPCRSISS